MDTLKISHPLALQFLMTDDLYAIETAESASIRAAAAPEPSIEPTFFEYLGENNKYILILVNDQQNKFLTSKELETLTNILKAKKQELKDVAILNLNKYPSATFNELKDFFVCNSIVLFGINPSNLKLESIPSNQITTYLGTKILATYSIAEMLNNADKKRVFWDEMKKL